MNLWKRVSQGVIHRAMVLPYWPYPPQHFADGTPRYPVNGTCRHCRNCDSRTTNKKDQDYENVAFAKPTHGTENEEAPTCGATNGYSYSMQTSFYIGETLICYFSGERGHRLVPDWLVVDLESVFSFDQMYISFLYNSPGMKYMLDTYIYVDAAACTKFPISKPGLVYTAKTGMVIRCAGPVIGRYMLLAKSNTLDGPLAVCEINLWVCKAGMYGSRDAGCKRCPLDCKYPCDTYFGCANVVHKIAMNKPAAKSKNDYGGKLSDQGGSTVNDWFAQSAFLKTCTIMESRDRTKTLWWRVFLQTLYSVFYVRIKPLSGQKGFNYLKSFSVAVTYSTEVPENPTKSQRCFTGKNAPGEHYAKLYCERILYGTYLWIMAKNRLGLCKLRAYGRPIYLLKPGSQCRASSYFILCGDGFCVDGECKASLLKECKSTDLCMPGLVCDSGICKSNLLGNCTDTEECMGDLVCDSGKCKRDAGKACQPGECKSETFCDPSIDQCMLELNAQCDGKYPCPPGSSCQNGRCRCKELYTEHGARMCEPIKHRIGGACKSDENCEVGTCTHDRCVCGENQEVSKQDSTTCRQKVGSECDDRTSETSCNTGAVCEDRVCKLTLRENCRGNEQHCKSGLVCDDNLCKLTLGEDCADDPLMCQSGITCSAGRCKSEVLGDCQSDAHCTSRLVCDSGTCRRNFNAQCQPGECKSGAFCDTSNHKCRLAFGQPCKDHRDMCAANAFCEHLKQCVLNLNAPCGGNKPCLSGASCQNGQCRCQAYSQPEGNACKPVSNRIGGACQTNSHCQVGTCDTGQHKCVCGHDEEVFTGDYSCRKKLGTACNDNAEGTRCNTGVVCDNGFCKLPLGKNCQEHEQHCASGLVCEANTCKLTLNKDCAGHANLCRSGTTCFSGKCKSTVLKACSAIDDCVGDLVCDSNKCKNDLNKACHPGQCKSGTFCDASVNKCRLEYGQSCQSHSDMCAVNAFCENQNQCVLKLNSLCDGEHPCPSNANCQGDQCQCQAFFEAAGNLCTPVKHRIGGACQTNVNCEVGTCSDGRCACGGNQEVFLQDRSCRQKVGTFCDAGSKCNTGAVCENGCCKLKLREDCFGHELDCKSGLVCEDSKCKLTLNQDCAGNEDLCRLGTTCSDGRCKIVQGGPCGNDVTLCASGICSTRDNNTCRMDVGQACNPETAMFCRKGSVCEHDKCKLNFKESCTSKSQCRRGLGCTARGSPPTTMCRWGKGYNCSHDDDCADDSICDNRKQCRIAKGGDCTRHPGMCLNGGTCTEGQCSCTESVTDPSTDRCVAAPGYYCSPNSTHARCMHGLTCGVGHICEIQANGSCEGKRSWHCTLGSLCDSDDKCRLNVHESCADNPNVCRIGTICDVLKRCKYRPGELCREDRDCVAGAHCNQINQTSRCQCTEGVSELHGGACVPQQGLIGGTCQEDSQCRDPHAVCFSQGQCVCKEGYAGDPKRLTCAKAVGEPCSENDKCTSGLICDPVNNNTCRIQVGQKCDGERREHCRNGSVCDYNVCKLGLHEDCSGTHSTHCKSGTFCDWLKRCSLGVGDTCPLGLNDTEDSCAAGATCVLAECACHTPSSSSSSGNVKCAEEGGGGGGEGVCSVSEREQSCVMGEDCVHSVCVCNYNVSGIYGDVCQPAPGRFGGSCQVECDIDNTVCADNTCQCVSEAVPTRNFSCVRSPVLPTPYISRAALVGIIVGISAGLLCLASALWRVKHRHQKKKRKDVKEIVAQRAVSMRELARLGQQAFLQGQAPSASAITSSSVYSSELTGSPAHSMERSSSQFTSEHTGTSVSEALSSVLSDAPSSAGGEVAGDAVSSAMPSEAVSSVIIASDVDSSVMPSEEAPNSSPVMPRGSVSSLMADKIVSTVMESRLVSSVLAGKGGGSHTEVASADAPSTVEMPSEADSAWAMAHEAAALR